MRRLAAPRRLALAAVALAAACAPADDPAVNPAPSPTATDSAVTSAPGTTSPASTASATTSMTSTTSTTPSPGSPATEIAVRVTGGRVDPAPRRVTVPVGTPVRLQVTSDVADTVHIHGYDEELALEPGRPGTLTFVADQPGLYEVETHETGLQLLQLVIR